MDAPYKEMYHLLAARAADAEQLLQESQVQAAAILSKALADAEDIFLDATDEIPQETGGQ